MPNMSNKKFFVMRSWGEAMRNLSAKPQAARGEAAFGHRVSGDVLGCDLCPRFCELAPGQSGWCKTRYNKAGRLWAANHNWLNLLQFGWLESVPLAEYARGGSVVKLGSFGSNFISPGAEREQLGAETAPGRTITPGDVLGICQKLVPQGCIGAAYTYGEPLMWYEFVMQTAMLLKQFDMRNILSTAGFINPRPLAELLGYLDAVRFDFFAFDPELYRSKMRVPFDSVLRSLKMLLDSPLHIEVATPLLPGQNTEPQQIGAIAAYLAKNYSPDIPYHLIAPHKSSAPLERGQIIACAEAARKFLNRVYLS